VTESGQIIPVKALVAAGDYAGARQQARAVTAGSPTQELWIELTEGLILAEQERYDEANRIFRSILSDAPDFEPARIELTSALVRSGQRKAALYHAGRLAAIGRMRSISD
jgi:predicted Zn-dependent protease